MSDAVFLPRARQKRLGLTPRQERRFNLMAGALICVMALGWTIALRDRYGGNEPETEEAPTPARMLASNPTDSRSSETAYLK